MPHPAHIDRFRVVRLLGTGGMGNVYEAVDPEIERRVAIKVLRADILTDNPELLQRLFVEARAANAIGHAGVVQISEAKLLPQGSGYLVMELLEGQTLTQRLRQGGGRLRPEAALSIAMQIASTLRAGHQRGIVHRDLKPDNVMLIADDAVTGGERVKLLDFGIAKLVSEAARPAPLTLADMGLGTPGYMAPEQMRAAAQATDRSDVYGLGAVLFEMLSGRRPHVASSTADLVVLVMSAEPTLISEFVPELPAQLVQLLAQMLRRDPPDARPSITDVMRQLLLISSELGSRRSDTHATMSQSSGAAFSAATSGERNRLLDTAPAPPTNLGLASEVQNPSEGSLRAPAASTISQMRGQQLSSSPSFKARLSRPWIAAGVGLALGLGGLLVWFELRHGSPLPNSGPALEAKNPVVATTPVLAVPAVKPAEQNPAEPSLGVSPKPTVAVADTAATSVPEKKNGKAGVPIGTSPAHAVGLGASGQNAPSLRCHETPRLITPNEPVVVKAVQDAVTAYKVYLCKGAKLTIRVNSGDGSLSIVSQPGERGSFNVDGFLNRIRGKMAASGVQSYKFDKITLSP